MKTTCFLPLLLTLATYSSATAGTWSVINWDTAAFDAAVTASKTYTHKVDFVGTGDAATVINGVTFESYAFPTTATGFSNGLVHSGATWSMDGGYVATTQTYGTPGTDFAMAQTQSTKTNVTAGPPAVQLGAGINGALLSDHLTSNIFETAFGAVRDYQLTLTNLTANTDYVFTFFSPAFAGAAEREAVLVSGFGDTSAELNQVNGTSDQLAIYSYNTGAATALTISVRSTNDNTSGTRGSLHTYAFANEVVPEPSVGLLAVLGGMAALRRRRRA